jgi:Delta7-sterol 5-desaturase
MWQGFAELLDHSPLRFGAVLLAFLLLRHFGIAAGLYLAFWKVWPARFAPRRIQSDLRPTHEGEEILWSLSTIGVQAIVGAGLFALFDRGYLRVYLDVTERGSLYFVGSIVALFVWHDAYFYWMHRVLHGRWLYEHVHLVHHRSTNPTPFSAFSFHPIEAVGEMAFLVPFLALVPTHPTALVLFLLITNFFAITGHLGYELGPAGAWDAWWGRWITTNTHHNLHHQFPNGNFALYLRYWDIWNGTLNAKTGGEFRRVTEGRA